MTNFVPENQVFQLEKSSKKKIENPFQTFWMAGFECTDQLNVHEGGVAVESNREDSL